MKTSLNNVDILSLSVYIEREIPEGMALPRVSRNTGPKLFKRCVRQTTFLDSLHRGVFPLVIITDQHCPEKRGKI
jgi:hypothetical protein